MAGDGLQSVRIDNPEDISRKSLEEIIVDLRLQIVGLSKDLSNSTAGFKEMKVRFEEFMKEQQKINQAILSNCNREERWTTVKEDLITCKDCYSNLETRVNNLERSDCPKQPILDDITNRVKAIEETHTIDQGIEQGRKPFIDFLTENFKTGVIVLLTALVMALLIKLGLPTS